MGSYPFVTFGNSGRDASGNPSLVYTEHDSFKGYQEPSSLPSSAGNGNLGKFAISVTSTTMGSRSFPADTSFKPYRREAYRHRAIATQRDSVDMTNIVGQGTLNTEGLWRREQTDWSLGAGQQYLDRKTNSQESRFLSSKGVDVFSFPLQVTLLPDTFRKDSLATPSENLLVSRCGDYIVICNDTTVQYVLAATNWAGLTTCTFGTTYGGTAPSHIYSVDTNDTYCFLATDTGIWFCNVGQSGGTFITTASQFQLYMAPDVTSGYTGGYDMVRWVNDQLICSRKSRLYAIQPRAASGYPTYGTIPAITDTNSAITGIALSGTTATVTTQTAHNLGVGQPITLQNTVTTVPITSITAANGLATAVCASNHGLTVGEDFIVSGNAIGAFNEKATVLTVTNNTTFTYNTNESATIVSGGTGGNITSDSSSSANGSEYGFNALYEVATVTSATTFTITGMLSSLSAVGLQGEVTTSTVPDMLVTHQNPQWVWSDSAAGETQIYFGGYVKTGSGRKYGGCVYRSNLLGSSTASATGTTTITSSNVFQPWSLDTPIQALPMSPDEYPTCVSSYLNFIFVGTNRGIRMCQTLSIYDPTATATGDLKAGPLIPNILQPVTLPVTAIVGDGRYVWFAWNNYDDSSTGLGKLDLQTFIPGDDLAPVYASDLMVTGQGIINSLDWDPYDNCPIMAIGGLGVFMPYASNEGGNLVVDKYVASGSITSGLFDYGIPDDKIPVFFDYGAIASASSGVSIQAFVEIDPGDEDAAGLTVLPSYPEAGDTAQSEFPVPNYHAEQFSVTLTLYSNTDDHANTPILHRWTLKSWPAVAGGSEIMAVLQLYTVSVVDGLDYGFDPYDNFIWLENLRQAQEIVTFQEGPLSVPCVIDGSDWIPDKRRENYQNGFEGDYVLSLKTIGPYVYTPVSTS